MYKLSIIFRYVIFLQEAVYISKCEIKVFYTAPFFCNLHVQNVQYERLVTNYKLNMKQERNEPPNSYSKIEERILI